MRDCTDGVTGILRAKSGLRRNKWRPIILLAAMVGIVGAVVFEAWMLLLPAILLPYAEARGHHRPEPPMDAAATFRGLFEAGRAPTPTPAATPNDAPDQSRRMQMLHIVDRILRHNPHLPAARLAKASMLWYFNGDAEGTRCHCRQILGRIQREDPLFEQVCDLYMRTYDSAFSRQTPPAHHSAIDADRLGWTSVAGLRQAKIIPFVPKL